MTFQPKPPYFIQRRAYHINGHTFYTVLVEKGTFMMGDDESPHSDEKPAHPVTLPTDFELCEYPVTQALWQAVMGEAWPESRFKGNDRPVERVSWDDTRQFFDRLNTWYIASGQYQKHPGAFCLPSEAQWEYAAGGGKYWHFFNYPYSGGRRLDELGWYDNNSHRETQPVCRKLPNLLGLCDMSGNVWEWCEDDWHDDYQDAPDDGSAWVDTPRGSRRVNRGGSWIRDADDCRVAGRYYVGPGIRRYDLGFRAAFVPQSGG